MGTKCVTLAFQISRIPGFLTLETEAAMDHVRMRLQDEVTGQEYEITIKPYGGVKDVSERFLEGA